MGYGLNTYPDTVNGGGGGAGGSIMYQTTVAYPYVSGYYPATSCYMPLYGSAYGGSDGGGYYNRPVLTKEELAEQKRRDKILQQTRNKQEREAQKRLANRTLADLSDESKEIFMNIVHKFYKEYLKEQEVKQIMSGLKWFFILLGLAIFFNFPTILKIIQTAIAK